MRTSLVRKPRPIGVPELTAVVLVVLIFGAIALKYVRASGLVGDLNNDGIVNVFDLSVLLSDWATTNTAADLSGDGIVNILDLSMLLSHWGQVATTPSPTGTPDPNQVLAGDPLAEQYAIDQSSYFATYKFPTSIDLMKITRDRSFPSLSASVIQADVQTFAAQMPHANTMTDDVFFDNVQGFQAWADAIHAAGRHVWFRGHFCNWEPVPQCGNTTDHSPSDYANSLTSFLDNSAVQEAIKPGDIFDPCSEPVDQLGSDTADLTKILLYTTKAAHDAFTAQGKNVLIVHSLSESSFTNNVISSNVLLRSGSIITIDSYPEDALSTANWSNPTTAATAATQAWKAQLDQISANYAQVIASNNVKIIIGEAGFPNNPAGVSDAVKVAVNRDNFSQFLNYPSLVGTNYWVGPGDDNAGGHTYLFAPQTNFDNPGWTVNASGQAINAVYGSK